MLINKIQTTGMDSKPSENFQYLSDELDKEISKLYSEMVDFEKVIVSVLRPSCKSENCEKNPVNDTRSPMENWLVEQIRRIREISNHLCDYRERCCLTQMK